MKLMTKAIEKKFKKRPLYSSDGKGMEAEIIVRYFNPYGRGEWLITEAEPQADGDWLLYGYMNLFEWEWGYVMLSELESVNLPFDLTIERDLYSSGTVADLCGDSRGRQMLGINRLPSTGAKLTKN